MSTREILGSELLPCVCMLCQCVSSVLMHPSGEPKARLEKVSFTTAVCGFSLRDDVLSSVAWQDNVTRDFAKVWSSLGTGKDYCRTMHAP